MPYSDNEEEEDADSEVVILRSLPRSSTPHKRRRRMLREPLDVEFLRRSSRLARGHGFHDASSAQQAQDNLSTYSAGQVAPCAPAPHLPLDLLQGITGGIPSDSAWSYFCCCSFRTE